MNASQFLMDEHDKILEMLEGLNRVCQRTEKGHVIPSGHLEPIIDFIRGLADSIHHAKEENLFFPALEKAGVPREGGPIGVMLAENEVGRNHVRLMEAAVQRLENGDTHAGEFFDRAMKLKNLNIHDVKAGREYLEAYVQYFHFIEGGEDAHAHAGGDQPYGNHADHPLIWTLLSGYSARCFL